MAVDSEVFSLLSTARELFVVELAAITVTIGVLIRARTRRRALEESARGARFRERHRIARELHDGAGHRMLAIVLHARQLSAQATAAQTGSAPSAARIIEELAVEAQREVREALGCLPRPDGPQGPHGPGGRDGRSGQVGRAGFGRRPGGGARLSDEVIALGADLPAVGLSVHLSGVEAESELSPEARHAALRIVQEGVTNALKHGEGPVDVRIHFGERLELSIHNRARRGAGRSAHGGPADTVPPLPGTGQGLLNMRRRAAEIGGFVEYQELPGGGVRIAADLPGRDLRPTPTAA
ncbi:histidine kinase [Streptomyces sp. NPDC005805]|uniref:sensor histidine kinase n=1 Tax=Streptomyces sp. NPDC005805 TaxID=3157068 RepID=UPI0033F77A29